MESELRTALTQQALQDRLAFAALKEKGENVLLWGKPGTGKTTLAKKTHVAEFEKVYMTTVTLDTPAAEWRGFFIPKPDPATGSPGMGWQDGLAVRAMGKCYGPDGGLKIDEPNNRFIVNEIHKVGPDLAALCHAVADDRNVAEVHLPNGDIAFSHEGLQIAATSNDPPEALDDPIQDRFTIRVQMDLPTAEAVESLPEDLQEFCMKMALLDYPRYLSFREVKAFARLRDSLGSALMAAQLVWEYKGRGHGREIVEQYALADI